MAIVQAFLSYELYNRKCITQFIKWRKLSLGKSVKHKNPSPVTPYNGLYGEAPSEGGTFLGSRGGKSVISV